MNDFDLNAALTAMHDQTRDRVNDVPVASVARRARHRRVLKRTGYLSIAKDLVKGVRAL